MAEKILVVDDSKLVTDIVRMRLSMYGYEVELAHSGEEALAKVAVAVPDLMVLDVQMPGIDGFETAAAIRSLERLRRVPIIFLSAQGDRRADGRDAYCEFILKPIDPEVIRPRVAAHLQKKGSEQFSCNT